MDGTSPERGCPRPDPAELHELVGDVELALLAATAMEAEILVQALEGAEPIEVATKRWWSGVLRHGDRAVTAAVIVTGYDKVNAAHALTCLLMTSCPALVVQVGAAGAYPPSGLAVGDVVLATEEVYADTGVATPEGWLPAQAIGLPLAHARDTDYWNAFPSDPGLVAAAARVVEAVPWPGPPPRVLTGRCLTSSLVTGGTEAGERLARRWGALAESMEGAAAAHVCALYGVPFLEIRGISNLVVDRDRASWDLVGAAERAQRAALAVAARLDEVLVATRGAAGPEEPLGGGWEA